MNFLKSSKQPGQRNLYPEQCILFSRLSWFPFGIYLVTFLLIFHLVPSIVLCQEGYYPYNGNDVYRQNLLSSYLKRNQLLQSDGVEPPVDDYTVDNNYEATQFKIKSLGNDGDDGQSDNLHSNQGKSNDGYSVGLVDDTQSSIIKNVDTSNPKIKGILSRLFPTIPQQQLQSDDQPGIDTVSSFIQPTPKPSSQVKVSGFHVDSSHPVTMYARASSSSSASASTRFNNVSGESVENVIFVGSVIGVTIIAITVVIATGYFVHRINIQRKAAADVEYPAYGVVGPGASVKEKESLSSSTKSASGTSKGSGSGTSGGQGVLSPSGDRRLAQSAQMYHYHHQKQQMISSDKVATEAGQHPSTSEVDSEEEENEEGDYTVYECPGLASTGEMEVKNPLFQDDITPVSSPCVKDAKHDNGSSN